MRVIVALLFVAACQPMYGGPPEHFPTLTQRARPAEPPPPPIVYVETCHVDFHRDPHTAHPQPTRVEPLVSAGDAAEAAAARTTDPAAKGTQVLTGLQKYAAALAADPYNAEATLKLALAYDGVRYKGCALALLRRLRDLSAHPQFARPASVEIDEIANNSTWFSGYRREALAAANL